MAQQPIKPPVITDKMVSHIHDYLLNNVAYANASSDYAWEQLGLKSGVTTDEEVDANLSKICDLEHRFLAHLLLDVIKAIS